MSFNRFRVYDLMQKSMSTLLFATTVAGSGFIGLNVYNNWVEKQKLQKEVHIVDKKLVKMAYKRMVKDNPESKSS
ncbi:hypothetical protein BX661DRAFT_86674 [Kickxella alabastrina]|uniref:uncharacterized protein n=1 Tax=Kickxella alabastrina TaxID=61397 RepID=UPI00221ED3F0|nr:uncharacterized protein BX661DRAFT_86674 [Kickxella alabastrina]KAI7832005.1 hypothetical protein BX661DRAFT_86674 [Kickxella alabastrina]KAJ1946812.1 hypothetical protein GGF37_000902 [Kickxella alabastrina]